MREIGVRELKAKLSETLHAVAQGEPIRVTLRGQPIAEIVPPASTSADDQLRALIAAGRLTPASKPRSKNPPPLIKGRGSASAIVLADRDAER